MSTNTDVKPNNAKGPNNADGLRTFSVFCRESSGEGTIYITSVRAKTPLEAKLIGLNECADQWEMDSDAIDVIGLAAGNVNILEWDDDGPGGLPTTETDEAIAAPRLPRLVVLIEGGVVQNILCDIDVQFDGFAVLDQDTEGADREDLVAIDWPNEGIYPSRCFVSEPPMELNEQDVKAVFEAIDKAELEAACPR